MKAPEANISTKAAAWVENHTWMSLLLVVLCLAFAVNLYFWGPGSDGGSGLGGTGLYGGESGLGGTGKSPDSLRKIHKELLRYWRISVLPGR